MKEASFKDTILEVYSWYKSMEDEKQSTKFKMKFNYDEIKDYDISIVFTRKET